MKRDNKRAFLRYPYSSYVMYTTLNYSSLLAEEGRKAKLFYWDKTDVAMKRNIMTFRSFHQWSLSSGDDFLCSSYPGGMDIRGFKAQNHDIMKKLIGSVIGSGDTVSANFDRWTANFNREMRGKISQNEDMRFVSDARWVLPMLISSHERREER